MSFQDEQAKILDMVAHGKITVEEADMLLSTLLGENNQATPEVEVVKKSHAHHVLQLSGEHKMQIGVAGVNPDFLRAVRQVKLPIS